MRSFARPTTLMAAVGAAAVFLVPPAALAMSPSQVTCGSVITADTTLTSDLVGCVGDGLIIGADGITLNLGGHVISGDSIEDPTDMGINVTGRSNVHILNGTVQRFYRGIVFESSPRGTVTSVTVRDGTRRGIVLADGSDDGVVEKNMTVDNGASGVAVVASDGVAVEGNQSLRNIGGAGVRLEGATHALVSKNLLAGDTLGMQIVDGADHNTMIDNHMTREVEVGVEMDFSNGNVLNGNHLTWSGGITLESSDDNTITRNQVLQLVGPDGIGIQIYGNDNLVAKNVIVGSVRYGIEVDDFQDEGHSPAIGNTIRANTVNGGGEGIAIGPEAGGVVLDTVIDDNRVVGADDDGIQLLGPSTGLATSTVKGNLAVHNGDLGIAAVDGTIDGGGNRAAGNGNPLQCVNISCA